LEQVPALADDVQTPEYCALTEDEEGGGLQAVNAWFGPAGTVTPLHTDPHHNLLAQVCLECIVEYANLCIYDCMNVYACLFTGKCKKMRGTQLSTNAEHK
jgi:hypothetical protein